MLEKIQRRPGGRDVGQGEVKVPKHENMYREKESEMYHHYRNN